MASVSFARNDVEDAKDLCKKMGFRIDFYGFNEDTVDGMGISWDIYICIYIYMYI